jgi:hypothetical protein
LSALVVVACAALPARADLIFFKDGFVVQGQVRRESVAEFDPQSKEMFTMPKGFIFIADGPRRIFFSPTQVRIAEKLPAPVEVKMEVGRTVLLLRPGEMPPILEMIDSPEWNSNWERTVTVRTLRGPFQVKQIMAELTSTYFRGDATEKVVWHAGYLTKELSPESLQAAVEANHALKDSTPRKDGKPADEKDILARRLRKIDFYGQSGFLDLAAKEIDRLDLDYPSARDRVESARRALVKLRSRDQLEVIKRRQRGGQYEGVRKALADFPEKDVPESILAEVREMRSHESRPTEAVKEADALLASLERLVRDPAHRLLATAAADIRKELHPDTVNRLEAFVGQARQAERQRAAGKKTKKTPEELISLAVTGWLLGSSSSESRPEAALNLWKTRQMVLAYLQEEDAGARQELLANYQKTVTPRVEPDEIAQLISTLPPVTPAKETDTEPVMRLAPAGRKPVQYHVQLPPEYSPNRPYPVLVALHEGGEKATNMLERWRSAAADNGIIVVAPEWEQGNAGVYTYSEAEHQAVLAALRDVKRSYQVDSDRVFLFGLGEGGRLAIDIGFAHPGEFAGLMPMGAAPFYYAARCWRNAQYLPMYVVNGSKAGDSQGQLRELFNYWLIRGYPALWITYVGRGQEWFAGELPNMCDWMSRQVRSLPMRQIGTSGVGGDLGNEFGTLRGHGQFYWLSIDDTNPRNAIPSIRGWSNRIDPATITGRLDPDTNKLVLTTGAVRKLTVWVVRTSRGQYNIDLEKPLEVMVGLKVVVSNRKLTPNLGVLLEDLYLRADHKHLRMGKIEITP